jgi:hypothetical protein
VRRDASFTVAFSLRSTLDRPNNVCVALSLVAFQGDGRVSVRLGTGEHACLTSLSKKKKKMMKKKWGKSL